MSKLPSLLTAKEKQIHDQGLVTVLRQIHDELDAAVLEGYGWSDLSAKGTHCSGNPPGALATQQHGEALTGWPSGNL